MYSGTSIFYFWSLFFRLFMIIPTYVYYQVCFWLSVYMVDVKKS